LRCAEFHCETVILNEHFGLEVAPPKRFGLLVEQTEPLFRLKNGDWIKFRHTIEIEGVLGVPVSGAETTPQTIQLSRN
jgi:hypothetical protein